MSSGTYDPAVSPNTPKLASFLCYVNGLLVPVLGVTATTSVNNIPYAQIEFYPSQLLTRLGAEDRVEVVVFYLDHYYTPSKPTYRLLFDGEIASWSYASSGEHRQFTATAVADISLLQQIQFALLNTVDDVAGQAGSAAGGDTVRQTSVYYGYSVFQDGLVYENAAAAGNPGRTPRVNIKRPFDILYNTVKALTSKKIPQDSRSLPMVNFYSRWARKRNFPNRFVACPHFDDPKGSADAAFPILEAAKAQGVLQQLQDEVAAPASQGSMYEILKDIYHTLYFEIATLMTPPAVKARASDGVIVDPTAREDDAVWRLANYYTKPTTLFAIPPMCNALFPSMVKAISYTENYRTQPTRVYLLDSSTAALGVDSATAVPFTTAYPPQAQAHIDQQLKNPASTGKNLLIWPEEFFKGPEISRGEVPLLYGILVKNWGRSTAESAAQSGAPANSTTGATTGSASSTSDEAQQKLKNLFKMFAQYEYFRRRYMERTGAADLVFNPYVVPGYPMVLFDRPGGLHQVGYIDTVSHTLTASSFTTAINYTAGRTINEWLAQISTDVDRHNRIYGSAPAEPFDYVRRTTQDFEEAERHYEILLHGRRGMSIDGATAKRKASFDVREVIQPVTGNPNERITLEGPRETDQDPLSTVTDLGGGARASRDGKGVTKNQTYASDEFAPTPGFDRLFKDATAGLTYTARPICSLDEYLKFRHGIDDLKYLPPAIAASVISPSPFPGVTVYGRIVDLLPTPENYTPPDEVTGVKNIPPPAGGAQGSGQATAGYRALDPATCQTRANWDSILIAYRDEVLKNVAPLE